MERKFKISFICTVLNEEKTIDLFLDSLFGQTRMPDEIVVVDGGSTDGTVDRMEGRKQKTENRKPKFKIIVQTGFNRSQGRNEAIRNAEGDIIVVSDAGCVLDRNWLQEIVKPFEKDKDLDVVAGFYLPTGDSILQKILGQLTSVPLEKINPETFLPSSRSIAFKKSVWEKVGGYPEDLRYNEDIIFAQSLRNTGLKFAFAPKAVVEWPQRKNLKEAMKQFFFYAVGDGMAKNRGPHFKRHLLKLGVLGMLGMFGAVEVIILGFFGAKALNMAIKTKKVLVFPVAIVLLPILSMTVLAGFVYGLIKKC